MRWRKATWDQLLVHGHVEPSNPGDSSTFVTAEEQKEHKESSAGTFILFNKRETRLLFTIMRIKPVRKSSL